LFRPIVKRIICVWIPAGSNRNLEKFGWTFSLRIHISVVLPDQWLCKEISHVLRQPLVRLITKMLKCIFHLVLAFTKVKPRKDNVTYEKCNGLKNFSQ
jgi:hypothetical protein